MSPAWSAAVMIMWAWMLVPTAMGQAGPADPAAIVIEDRDGFLKWCAARVPRKGSVMVTYGSPAGTPQVIVGLDAGTRAWYFATDRSCGGRTASGEQFRGAPGGVTFSAPGDKGGTPLGIAEYIPAAYLYHFLEEPESIREVLAHEDGGWTITYQRESPTERPLAMVRIDATGRVMSSWQRDEDDRRERTPRYQDEVSPCVFEIATGVGAKQDRVVTDLRCEPSGADTRMFDISWAENASRGVAIEVQTALAARRLGYERDEAGHWDLRDESPRARYEGQGIIRWRWPVFGAGFVLVAIGGVEYLRRRAS